MFHRQPSTKGPTSTFGPIFTPDQRPIYPFIVEARSDFIYKELTSKLGEAADPVAEAIQPKEEKRLPKSFYDRPDSFVPVSGEACLWYNEMPYTHYCSPTPEALCGIYATLDHSGIDSYTKKYYDLYCNPRCIGGATDCPESSCTRSGNSCRGITAQTPHLIAGRLIGDLQTAEPEVFTSSYILTVFQNHYDCMSTSLDSDSDAACIAKPYCKLFGYVCLADNTKISVAGSIAPIAELDMKCRSQLTSKDCLAQTL